MKKIVSLFGVLIFLSACTDAEAYETNISTLEQDVQDLTASLTYLEEEKEEQDAEITRLTDENDIIKKDYDKYKERMTPYEELEESEAQARKIEADKIAAEEKEAADKKKAEEEAAKKAKQDAKEKEQAEKEAAEKAEEEAAIKAEEEELARGYETGITYDQLARTPDDYMGEKIKFSGKVIQVIEGDEEIQLRFAVNDDYDQVIYVAYSPDIVEQRVLEDDYLTISGYSLGTVSYESTIGGVITIPSSVIEIIEFN
ncbi:hypothetical protein ACO1PF_05820 [Alkalibacterium sp. f15]|uniref:hypothetical protein n=1 Tax=Alkalibacterium sp. f15 TaxID=3414029 RepID=UPI003BF78A00